MNAFANEYPSFDLREYLPSIKQNTNYMWKTRCAVSYSIFHRDT